jgi:pimeloyl-ACP methyl ester carboxylesterase
MLLLLILTTACGGSAPSPTPLSARPWIEEEVTFTFGQDELYGILTLPTSKGCYPAIVIVSGSVNPSTGARDGVSALYHIDHAHQMVLSGFAVLRYDPPGVGQSRGERGIESLDSRTEEAVAALQYLQSRPDIRPDRVGLWADSQGAWVIAMAAAAFPQDVAFIISVSGSGVSVAEQQVYSIEAQSKAAGMSEEDITKAILFGRLLVDWQLSNPIYRQANTADAQALGDGPPKEYLTRVHCPVLAFFGEADLLQPTEKSAALYEQYLTEAGNENFKIVVIPAVGHGIGLWTPGYWEALSDWLDHLYSE